MNLFKLVVNIFIITRLIRELINGGMQSWKDWLYLPHNIIYYELVIRSYFWE